MWYIIIFIATLLLDQISKILIDVTVKEGKVLCEIIPDFLQIKLRYNYGASFSLFGNKSWAQAFFIVLTVVVLIAGFVFVCIKKPHGKWLNTAIALMFSGIIGNFIDRVSFQKVRDFIYFPWFANCNIADFCISIGEIMLFVYVLFWNGGALFKGKGERQKATENATENATEKSSSDGENLATITDNNVISETENISGGENISNNDREIADKKDEYIGGEIKTDSNIIKNAVTYEDFNADNGAAER